MNSFKTTKVVDNMLREFDDTVGRCSHCSKMVLRDEVTLSLNGIAHKKCKDDFYYRSSLI